MPLPFLLPNSNPILLLNEARKSEEMMIRGNPWEEERRSKEEERRSEHPSKGTKNQSQRAGTDCLKERGRNLKERGQTVAQPCCSDGFFPAFCAGRRRSPCLGTSGNNRKATRGRLFVFAQLRFFEVFDLLMRIFELSFQV